MRVRACFALGALALCGGVAVAQYSDADLDAMRAAIAAQGGTFNIAPPADPNLTIADLCKLEVPPDWRAGARFQRFAEKSALPEKFDLRPYLPPVRDQKNCGSCWAFATVGALECAIGVRDGVHVDLSEQYLISCNSETSPPHVLEKGAWGCEGGWFAHDYFLWKPDPCGGFGAVLETNFPYLAANAPCNCPYPRAYTIDDWAYVTEEEALPSVENIKRALMQHGPISAAVYVGSWFYLYSGGVYNNFEGNEVNHGIVLVGWDDTMGSQGAWILRNSWGTDWGEEGYMYIAYGCCSVGYGACFVDYPGAPDHAGPAITRMPHGGWAEAGGDFRFEIEADTVGEAHYAWTRDGASVGGDEAVCLISPLTMADAGIYACAVTDLRGTSVSAGARLQVLPDEAVPAADTWGLLALGAGLVMLALWRWRQLRAY